uniref:C2H2-type domain-containing protein n=1 Tax=viral metagenome TaxID=1070528 RepID=A0A6C0D8F0_9ZZZZ
MEYKCEHCNFNTKKKYNYDKHLLSNKHKLVESKSVVSQKLAEISPKLVEVSQKLAESSNEISNLFKCKYCEQCYKHKSSLSKHIKYSCNKNKTEDLTELVRLLNLQLEHKDKQLETQSKQIEKLMEKLEINTYTNSNNTIINNVTNINLLNYKDTDTSHLTNVDYKKCLKEASRCVLKLIEKVHFNPDKPENMNIYISNMKNNYMMMYKENKWNLVKKEEMDSVYNHKEDLIIEWFNLNKDPELMKYFERFMDLKEDKPTVDAVQEEYKLLLFNNRNLIKN